MPYNRLKYICPHTDVIYKLWFITQFEYNTSIKIQETRITES